MNIYTATGAEEEPEAWESIAALMTERTRGIKDTTAFSSRDVQEIHEEYMKLRSNIFGYRESVKREYDGKRDEVISMSQRGCAANAIGQVLDSYRVEGL